ncbi:hypothetical protein [Peribacillus simplex]|uniref:hypothetical protein n=1 Tax=Peribacillus simplex TaxID=1478 RepID=UPI001E4CB53F|nr:hypothetical protein [Peribacillus simplex]MDR4926554.1 hypothetical protein [Peribacillus simplex]
MEQVSLAGGPTLVQATITDIAKSGKTTLKNIGEELGKKEIPKRISVEQVSLAGGPNLPQVVMEKQTIKEAYPQNVNNFKDKIENLLFKWVNRRSQRKSFTCDKYRIFLNKYPLPSPRIKVNIYALRKEISYIL